MGIHLKTKGNPLENLRKSIRKPKGIHQKLKEIHKQTKGNPLTLANLTT